MINIPNLFMENSIIGIVGPNGSGKSTLLKIISGCIDDFKGSSLVDGINIVENHKDCARKIGALIENPWLYSYVNSYEMLEIAHKLRKGEKCIGEEIEEDLKSLGLLHKKNVPLRDLSSGEKKRLSIGLAVTGSPDIIILDEPTDNMDAVGVDMFENLINRLKNERERLIIITSHDLDIIGKICDRIIFLMGGEIRKDLELKGEGYYFILHTDENFKPEIMGDFSTEYSDKGKIAVWIDNEEKLNKFFRIISEKRIRIKNIAKITRAELEYKKIMGSK